MTLLTLACLLLVVAVAAQRPVLKYGLTLSQCGVSASISTGQKQTLEWYANYTNAHGGVNISGLIHDVEFVIYNDAFDLDLLEILYERLINVDKVDLLIGPLGYGSVAFAVAQKYNRVIMNGGDFSYYASIGAPNGTFGGWLFSAVPNPLGLPEQCYNALAQQGAKTVSSAWSETNKEFNLVSIFAAGRQGLTVLGTAPTISNNFENLDDVIAKMKAVQADVWSGTMLSPEDSHTVIDRMLAEGYNPNAFVVWVGPNYKRFRDLAPWQAAGIFFPNVYDPSLGYKDKLFGDSRGFYDAFVAGVGREPDTTDVIAVFAAEAMRLAVQKAGTTDSVALRQALLELNEETFIGIANFTGAPLQQTSATYTCFQVDEQGVLAYPVTGTAPSRKAIRYPVKVNYPSGYKSGKSNTSKWLGLGLGLGLGLPFVACIALFFWVMIVKYQVVFIPKAEDKGEW